MEGAFFQLAAPLAAVPAQHQIRAANFQGFQRFVDGHGRSAEAILDRFALDGASIADPDNHVDVGAYVDTFEYCARAFNDPLFGLHLARHQSPGLFGCLAALCRSATDVRTALQSLLTFLPVVHTPAASMCLVETHGSAEYRFATGEFGPADQTKLQGAMLTLFLLREIGGRDIRLKSVTLDIDIGWRAAEEAERLLGCPFRTSPNNAIVLFRHDLARPAANPNRMLFALLSAYLERVRATRRTTLCQRVEDYVSATLPSGRCSVARCARQLGMSERKLQLDLGAAGVTFSDMVEEQRRRLSEQYLLDPGLSLDEVSCLLGYSEQSSFGRAFKRWTQSTPRDYRARMTQRAAGHA